MKPKLVPSESESTALEDALNAVVDQELAEHRAVESIERSTASLTEAPPKIDYKLTISHTRAWCDRYLPELAAVKVDLQTRMAAAKAAYDATVERAKTDLTAISEEIHEELHQVTTTLEILTRAQGDLTKAELPR